MVEVSGLFHLIAFFLPINRYNIVYSILGDVVAPGISSVKGGSICYVNLESLESLVRKN